MNKKVWKILTWKKTYKKALFLVQWQRRKNKNLYSTCFTEHTLFKTS